MKVYVVIHLDYDRTDDVEVYRDKQEILNKRYKEKLDFINSNPHASEEQKEVWRKNIKEWYENGVLTMFDIWERELK